MPLDHYVTLGRSGLRVSPFCLGAMTFGDPDGSGCDDATSAAIIDRFLERGGNFIDTANVYSKGHAERVLGEHVGRVPHKRQRVVLATKFGGNLYAGDPNGGGAGRKAIHQQLENSLRRLRTDVIDLYWLHVDDKHTPLDELLRTLDDVVRQGKVRHIGFSDTAAWKVATAQMMAKELRLEPLVALQIEYSLLERTVEGELVPMALHHGLGITPWSPLKAGALSGKYARGKDNKSSRAVVERALTDRTWAILDEVRKIAEAHQATPAQVSLSWLRAQPGVTAPILGARTVAQLDDNLGALDVTLSKEDLAALDKVSRPTLNFPADFLRIAPMFTHGGNTLNGETGKRWPGAPAKDEDRA